MFGGLSPLILTFGLKRMLIGAWSNETLIPWKAKLEWSSGWPCSLGEPQYLFCLFLCRMHVLGWKHMGGVGRVRLDLSLLLVEASVSTRRVQKRIRCEILGSSYRFSRVLYFLHVGILKKMLHLQQNRTKAPLWEIWNKFRMLILFLLRKSLINPKDAIGFHPCAFPSLPVGGKAVWRL